MILLPNGRALGGPLPLACAPLVAASLAGCVAQAGDLRQRRRRPDLVELRADHLRDVRPEAMGEAARAVADALGPHLPLLVTLRSPCEGGATDWSNALRVAGLLAAIHSGRVALVDVERAVPLTLRAEVLSHARNSGVGVIISAHDTRGTPDDATLDALLADLAASGGGAAKLAVTAREPGDALRLLAATRRATAGASVPLITMAMGAAGAITRLEGPRYGSALSFASVVATSAPGQLPLALVLDYWRATGLRP